MDKREDLFAATPPLEAKKMLMSMAVTEGVGYKRGDGGGGKKLELTSDGHTSTPGRGDWFM